MYALITHHDEGYQRLADLTWNQNKLKYASRHGYAAHAKTNNWTSKSSSGIMTGFEKLYIAKEVLSEHPEYDWVWWTGTDTMITNFAVRIEDRIDNNYHFIICVDVNGINADSILIRNSPESLKFLDDVLTMEEECVKHWDHEQRAIALSLGFPVTASPDWVKSPLLQVSEKYQSVVKVMPQRFMNSFYYKLYNYTDQRDTLGLDGNWHPGDWLIHWPATSIDVRIQLYNAFLPHIME
jgi:hypothetical protein